MVLIAIIVAVVIPGAIWIQDTLTNASGFFKDLGLWIALLLVPVLWLIGNVLTLIVYALKWGSQPSKLFIFQCAVSVCFLLLGFGFWVKDQGVKHALHQQWAVRDAILSQDVKQYQRAMSACGQHCEEGSDYDEWLALSVAVNAPAMFEALRQDARFHQTPWVGLNAPSVELGYSCKGYYLGETNLLELAVLLDDGTMTEHITPHTNQDEKNAALWYAVRANKVDRAQWWLKHGADPAIKDALGIEHNGHSLLDAAIEGYAVESLEWLLAIGYPANGPIGQNETSALKHTPLHSLVYAAENELRHRGTMNQSLRMLAMLINNGADTSISKPHEYGPPMTALQTLLESNVYEQSAYVVQQLVKHGLVPQYLTPQQQQKLTEFMAINTEATATIEKPDETQCAETLIKNGMRYE